MNPKMKIGKSVVGGENPCFVTAEIGINHDGNFNQALKLIDAASEAKCDAVKFQLFSAKKMYAKNPGKHKVSNGKYVDIYKIVEEAELPNEWIFKLVEYSHKKNLAFICTTCDEASTDVLSRYDIDAYKIASSELTHVPLIKHVSKKRKPVIISSGASYLHEIEKTLLIFDNSNIKEVVLLHCVAQYPVPLDQLNLNVMSTLRKAFPDKVIGFSDHSSNPTSAPKTAVVLGAKMIEKHITLDRKLPGPDHSFALSPKDLARMVSKIRKTEDQIKAHKIVQFDQRLLGTSRRIPYEIEIKKRLFTYRSIFTTRTVEKGEKFSKKNIAVLRPGNNRSGLEPWVYELLIGKHHAVRNLPVNCALTWNDILA